MQLPTNPSLEVEVLFSLRYALDKEKDRPLPSSGGEFDINHWVPEEYLKVLHNALSPEAYELRGETLRFFHVLERVARLNGVYGEDVRHRYSGGERLTDHLDGIPMYKKIMAEATGTPDDKKNNPRKLTRSGNLMIDDRLTIIDTTVGGFLYHLSRGIMYARNEITKRTLYSLEIGQEERDDLLELIERAIQVSSPIPQHASPWRQGAWIKFKRYVDETHDLTVGQAIELFNQLISIADETVPLTMQRWKRDLIAWRDDLDQEAVTLTKRIFSLAGT